MPVQLGKGYSQLPFLKAGSVSIKLRTWEEQYVREQADLGGRGEVWPWWSKVDLTPSPALIGLAPQLSLSEGGSTAAEGHTKLKATRTGPAGRLVGLGERWDPGTLRCGPQWALSGAPLPSALEPHTPEDWRPGSPWI